MGCNAYIWRQGISIARSPVEITHCSMATTEVNSFHFFKAMPSLIRQHAAYVKYTEAWRRAKVRKEYCVATCFHIKLSLLVGLELQFGGRWARRVLSSGMSMCSITLLGMLFCQRPITDRSPVLMLTNSSTIIKPFYENRRQMQSNVAVL